MENLIKFSFRELINKIPYLSVIALAVFLVQVVIDLIYTNQF